MLAEGEVSTTAHSTGDEPVQGGTSRPADASAGLVHNKGEGLLEVKAHEALHGGTSRLAEPYSAAIPVEKIDTPLPGVTTEGGTSRLAYGVEAPPSDMGAGRPI
ncbi:hypothetical protein COCOBI_12-4160 [Coccomyxa sp. Obi]|nr:hypothetical protein COCOBI_12-4160 [Coccomyxa sp. Obi]